MSFAISATELQTLSSTDTVTEVDETDQMQNNVSMDDQETDDDDDTTPAFLLRGFGRFLSSKKKSTPKIMTCDKYPKVCRTKGSVNRDCCKKKCVNMSTDMQNCGKCGKKCKFSQSCCKGKCINTMSDKNNCGGCGRKCKKGRKCRFGMCNYA